MASGKPSSQISSSSTTSRIGSVTSSERTAASTPRPSTLNLGVPKSGSRTTSANAAVVSPPPSREKSSTIPQAFILWNSGGKFEQINLRQFILSDKSSRVNPLFKFNSEEWHKLTHGYILDTLYTKNGGAVGVAASSNVNPSTARILLVNVLNPLQATSIKNMRLGTAVITLPLSSNDKGQHKHFLVSKDVPPGYYLLNLITKFPNQNINLVYTGKAFVPQPTPQVVTKTHTIIHNEGLRCGPGTHEVNGKCVPCPTGQHKDSTTGRCIPDICTKDPKAVGCPGVPDCTKDPKAVGCPTSQQQPLSSTLPTTTTTCPAGSTPDASGNCSVSQPTQQLLLPPPPPPSNGCSDGSKTDCSSQTPTTPNTGGNGNGGGEQLR